MARDHAVGAGVIRARIKEMSDDEALQYAIDDNERVNLSFIDKALACDRLSRAPYGKTQDQIAELFHTDRSTISEWTSALACPADIQDLIADGSLPLRQARSLATIPDRSVRIEVANQVVQEGLNRDETDLAVKRVLKKLRGPARQSRPTDGSSDVISQVVEDVTSGSPAQSVVQFLKSLRPRRDGQKPPSRRGALALLGLGIAVYVASGLLHSQLLGLLGLVLASTLVVVGMYRLLRNLFATHRQWLPALLEGKWSLPASIRAWPRKVLPLFTRLKGWLGKPTAQIRYRVKQVRGRREARRPSSPVQPTSAPSVDNAVEQPAEEKPSQASPEASSKLH